MQSISQCFTPTSLSFDPLSKIHAQNISDTLNFKQDISDANIFFASDRCQTKGMDNKQIRLANLQRLIKQHGGTQEEFSSFVNCSPAYISQLKSQKTKAGMGDEFARRLETAFKLEHGWMDQNHDTPANASQIDPETTRRLNLTSDLASGAISLDEFMHLLDPTAVILPFYDIGVSCGTGTIVYEPVEQQIVTLGADLAELGLKPDQAFWCYASGNSMEPTIHAGDRLLIERKEGDSLTDLINGRVYLFSWNEELFCKRLIRQIDGSLLVKSENPDYPATSIRPGEDGHFTLIGRVRRTYSTQDIH